MKKLNSLKFVIKMNFFFDNGGDYSKIMEQLSFVECFFGQKNRDETRGLSDESKTRKNFVF